MKMKNKYDNLIIAGIAVLFVNSLAPLLDAVCGLGISAINKTINGWRDEMECSHSQTTAIGFQMPEEVEQDYDNECKRRKW